MPSSWHSQALGRPLWSGSSTWHGTTRHRSHIRSFLERFKQGCIKFKKFNSSSVQGIELRGQFKFTGQKLNLNCCSTHRWTFLNWVQSQFKESGVPPAKKEKELQNFVCHGKEKAQFPLFSTRGHSTLSELTLNSVQKSSMVSWAAVQVQFLSVNWTWIDHWVRGKKLNWIENFNSVLNCYTALVTFSEQ